MNADTYEPLAKVNTGAGARTSLYVPEWNALFVAIPTVGFLASTQTVKTMPLFMYIIMAAIGVLFTLIGSYIGERIQMGPPPKAAE